MNLVYISQLYLNLSLGSHAHQLFVSGKARDQSKWPKLNQQQLSFRTEAQARPAANHTSSTPEVTQSHCSILNHRVDSLLCRCPFWSPHSWF